jgi:hypothetical protein
MPELELLTIANHAEAINGLLYLSGAGWTDLRRPMPPQGPPPINHLGIGIAVLVAWIETNQPYRVTIRIENSDGAELMNLHADFEVGRPPGLAPGSDLRAVIAVNGELQFPAADIYRVVATVGEQQRSITFRVHDIPVPATPPRR